MTKMDADAELGQAGRVPRPVATRLPTTRDMSSKHSERHNSCAQGETRTESDRPYTTHIESPDQGGLRYERCRDCQRECIVAHGGFDGIIHADDCRFGGDA